jgi:LacI family transcriptional regulator
MNPPVKNKTTKPTGIKEIAAALNISIGTVDRALHDRPGVSPKTRARVMKMAEKLNYRPNVAARSLKLNRRMRIGVNLPRQIASFFDPLREGIRAAAAATHGLNLELDFQMYPRLGDGDLEMLEGTLERHYDGLILTPGDPVRMDPLVRRLTQQGTAVVCVASDAPRTDRLAAVCVDAAASGGIAAELFGRVIREKGPVATITGSLGTLDHAEKLRGFAATLATVAPHLSLLPVMESHERPKEAYQATLALLGQRPRPLGIYISTANSLPVLRALEEQRMLGQIEIITTDLFPDLVPLIESGKIMATLYQRPFTQGKVAMEMLAHYLTDGVRPETVNRLAPHIVLRSNLPLFLNRISANGSEADDR